MNRLLWAIRVIGGGGERGKLAAGDAVHRANVQEFGEDARRTLYVFAELAVSRWKLGMTCEVIDQQRLHLFRHESVYCLSVREIHPFQDMRLDCGWLNLNNS